MKHNEKEVRDVAMSKDEVIGLLEAVKIIGELTGDTKEVCKAITRIQDKMKEPSAQTVASEAR